MAKSPAWAVSAAILLRKGEAIQVDALAASVIETGLSGLGAEGITPGATLRTQLRQPTTPKLFVFHDGGMVGLADGAAAISNDKVKKAAAHLSALFDAPIDVEVHDLTDDAIDAALRANRLRFGIIPTDMQEAIERQRRGQGRLKALTVLNYRGGCAVCDITGELTLIASHIVGWAEAPEHRGNLSNVICLSRIHDSLFEAGYWSLDDQMRILKKSASSATIALLLDAMTRFKEPVAFPPAVPFVRQHRQRAGL
jgi:hypothetical protein